MFVIRRNVHRSLVNVFQRRTLAAKAPPTETLHAKTPLAVELEATGVWSKRARRATTAANATSKSATKESKATAKTTRASKTPTAKGDRGKVNIVSEELCDDILAYVGSSLERHKGCDILDLYPGAGLWSQKLNEYLQPRSHLLLEPDADLYKPFLDPILQKSGTTLLAKSGIVWAELAEVLNSKHLPHQTPAAGDGLLRRNDTLLVTANLAFSPKRRFRGFDSVAKLVLHQFLDSIHTSNLFQQYGLVRMLLWTRCDDKSAVLPKTLARRKRIALEGELSCEWIREVCGRGGDDSQYFRRDSVIDVAGAYNVLQNMRKAGLEVPTDRKTPLLKLALDWERKGEAPPQPGTRPADIQREFQKEAADYTKAFEKGKFEPQSEEYLRMKDLVWRMNYEGKRMDRQHQRMAELDGIIELHRSGKGDTKEVREKEQVWENQFNQMSDFVVEDLQLQREHLHTYRQDPPVLHWDRREYEPLTVQANEFFPNVECALLDIQPKAMHPLFREVGPQSNRAGDSFNQIAGAMLSFGAEPIDSGLNALWPGAAEQLLENCPSLYAPDQGGVPVRTKHASLTPRMMNSRQYEEILEQWMKWPFKPSFEQLVGRTLEEQEDKDPGANISPYLKDLQRESPDVIES